MVATWLPFAIKRPGPGWKVGYPGVLTTSLDEKEGEVKHSAEGSLAGAFSVLDGGQQSSWHFTIAKDGRTFQHYPLEAVTWHAGLPGDRRRDTSLIGNLTLIGEEHEGKAGEPLTGAQFTSSLKVTAAIRQLCPHIAARPPTLKVNLWEHRWLSATACPSGRIPWQPFLALKEDDMAAIDELRADVQGREIYTAHCARVMAAAAEAQAEATMLIDKGSVKTAMEQIKHVTATAENIVKATQDLLVDLSSGRAIP